jgi:acetyltransferase
LGIENLDSIFKPKRIAVIGASNQIGSIGYTLFNNLIGIGFKGFVYPVNPFSPSIQGITAYPNLKKIPWQVDLAIIATPAHIVPQIVKECGESGVKGVIIVSSGFSGSGFKGRLLEKELVQVKQTYCLRIVGPNCIGVMRPNINLNASFAKKMAKKGQIAFVSQSGALCASVLDWAALANVGFSYFVSIGNMIDIDWGDLIDYFGIDPETKSIILFIEAIKNSRKFMSAARRFARTKPILVVKTGKSREGTKAAASHTGAITGEDKIYDAFFKRAGVIRVGEIADLFNCSELLAMQPLTKGPNLAIITNAGGPGVMATDTLIGKGGKLASLSENTILNLDNILPYYWSKGNPIDICEDATVDRFKQVLDICFKDPQIDGYLVIYTPIGAADPTQTAEALIKISNKTDKTILTSWLGEEDVQLARTILRNNMIPTFSTPEQAVTAFIYMYQYANNLELLFETPEELTINLSIKRKKLQRIINEATNEGREFLTEIESKEFLTAYGIPTTQSYIAKSPDEAINLAVKIGYVVVMKILSPDVSHKTDINGVRLNVYSDSEVKRNFNKMMKKFKKDTPKLKLKGITIQPMIFGNYELMIGAKKDPLFGTIITFGMGGIFVELIKDISIGFPPLNQILAKRMIEQTQMFKIISEGFRGKPPITKRLLEEVLVKFSNLIIDFPQIKTVDINPILVNEKSITALDSRIILDIPEKNTSTTPYKHLIIKPYPTKYSTIYKLRDGSEVLFRPIRPEDEHLVIKLFKTFSKETIRYRFFQVIKEINHEALSMYCNIDYDREMTIVTEITEKGKRKIIGMVRLIIEPDCESGEVAVVVGDPWQNRGIGSKLFRYIVKISEDMGLKRIFGEILSENTKMIHICCKNGFTIEPIDKETCLAKLILEIGN